MSQTTPPRGRLLIGALAVVGAVAGLYILLGNLLFSETYDMLAQTMAQRGESRAASIGDQVAFAIAAELASETEEVLKTYQKKHPETTAIIVTNAKGEPIASIGNVDLKELSAKYSSAGRTLSHLVEDQIIATAPSRPSPDAPPVGAVIYVESMNEYIEMRSRMLQLAGLAALIGLIIVATLLANQIKVSYKNATLLQNVKKQAEDLQQINVRLEKEIEERTEAQRELSNYKDHLEELVKLRTEKLKKAQDELLEASHQAGMAEVATNVLHNVGNALNSVNVGIELLRETIRKSKIESFFRVADIIHEHSHDIGTFMTSDRKGQQLPEYLWILKQKLKSEQESKLTAINRVTHNIDHIKHIVATQQQYTKATRFEQQVELDHIIQDAQEMLTNIVDTPVKISTELATIPPVMLDKRKLIQILIGVLKNAIEACAEKTDAEVRIVTAQVDDQQFTISVMDNGIGIEESKLAEIFTQGYSTKGDSQGFDLHYCGNTIKVMEGTIEALSEGPGHGATIVITLPLNTAVPAQELNETDSSLQA